MSEANVPAERLSNCSANESNDHNDSLVEGEDVLLHRGWLGEDVESDKDSKVAEQTEGHAIKSRTNANNLNTEYHIKWIKFHNQSLGIVTQNQNGPCPLLAIINILLLKGKIAFEPGQKSVTGERMIDLLSQCIQNSIPNNLTKEAQLNYEQNMVDALQTIQKLTTGLDVNVKFDSITSFEYTSELIVFDLLGIQLYHGWLTDPEEVELSVTIGNCSYNQLVEKIISNKASESNSLLAEALMAEDFLEKTASQLTYVGLTNLVENVKENELCVLFRNNHFITLYKHLGNLYQLVTDQGFLQERDIVWETLNNIENDGIFVNGQFETSSAEPEMSPTARKEQIDKDYLLALSMQEEQENEVKRNEQWNEYKRQAGYYQLNDEELARRLQEEEKKMQNAEWSGNEQRSSQMAASPYSSDTSPEQVSLESQLNERGNDGQSKSKDKGKDNLPSAHVQNQFANSQNSRSNQSQAVSDCAASSDDASYQNMRQEHQRNYRSRLLSKTNRKNCYLM